MDRARQRCKARQGSRARCLSEPRSSGPAGQGAPWRASGDEPMVRKKEGSKRQQKTSQVVDGNCSRCVLLVGDGQWTEDAESRLACPKRH